MRDRQLENETVRIMAAIYCRGNHPKEARAGADLCPECAEVYEYAQLRTAHCPMGEKKTTCGRCPIHCYSPAMRERIQRIMRYAGPRMLFHHPLMAIRHLRSEL